MTFKGYNKEYSVQEIFHVESGKRVTEQQVYQHLGKVPVVTSKSLGEGISWYADEEWLKRKGKIYEHPLITWTKEGYAGKFFFRNYKFFPIDVCGVLVLRDEFKDKVNMNWFIFTQQENFYKNVYSKYGKNIIIVAHSFGTFIGFHGSDEVDKMILFGSVLHCRENFSGIVPDRIKEIHNFHSTTDEICMLNPIGHSGAWGIRCKNTKTKKWYRRPYKDKQIFNYKSIVTEHTQYFPLYFSNILKLIA